MGVDLGRSKKRKKKKWSSWYPENQPGNSEKVSHSKDFCCKGHAVWSLPYRIRGIGTQFRLLSKTQDTPMPVALWDSLVTVVIGKHVSHNTNSNALSSQPQPR